MPSLPDVEPDQQDPQVHLAPNTDMLIAQARLADRKLLAQGTSESEVAQIASSIAKHRPKRRQPNPNGKGEKAPKTKRADRKISKQKHTLEFKRAPRSGSTKLKSEGSPGVRTQRSKIHPVAVTTTMAMAMEMAMAMAMTIVMAMAMAVAKMMIVTIKATLTMATKKNRSR